MKKKKLIGVLLEIIYYLVFIAFVFVMKSIHSVNVSYDFSFCVAFITVCIGLMVVSGSHLNKYLGFVFAGLYSIYLITQKVYHKGFKSYYRFATALELSKEVSEQGAAISELTSFADWIPLVVLLVITVIFLAIRYCLRIKPVYKWYVRVFGIVPIVVSFVLVNGVVNKIESTNFEGNWQVYQTDFYLYDTVNNPETFVNKFGLLTYGYRDAQTLLEQSKNVSDFKDEIDHYIFNRGNDQSSNDFTGLFEGRSLFLIQAESLMNLAIDEDLTPTLYGLMNSSISVTNFDTPLLIGSTSDSEFMTNTSFIPESDGYSVCYKYVNNTLPLTLGNLFKSEGYKTNAFHNNYAEYYNRNVTLNNYGYEFKDSYLLGLESESPDNTITEQIGWIDSEKDDFMSFWISYSGHQPYESGAVGVDEDDANKVREKYPGLADEYVYYLAKIMDFDKSIQTFLNIMEWTGRYNDVVIVVYGDHPAKGLDFSVNSNFTSVTGINTENNPEVLYTPLFIWSNDVEYQEIDKYCTCLDLLPTIANLWDIDYDHSLVFGNDIMDDSYPGWCFDVSGNYWNSDFRYDAISGMIDIYGNISKDEALKLVNDFNDKRSICNKILKIDYFNE